MAREPATTDVRLMRDFADMRPVDIARAYGYQRIAAMLDPARPVELLAYITSSESHFHSHTFAGVVDRQTAHLFALACAGTKSSCGQLAKPSACGGTSLQDGMPEMPGTFRCRRARVGSCVIGMLSGRVAASPAASYPDVQSVLPLCRPVGQVRPAVAVGPRSARAAAATA